MRQCYRSNLFRYYRKSKFLVNEDKFLVKKCGSLTKKQEFLVKKWDSLTKNCNSLLMKNYKKPVFIVFLLALETPRNFGVGQNYEIT